MYIPVSSGLRLDTFKSPEFVSVILGLLGETMYPLETEGAKLDISRGMEPTMAKFADRELNNNKYLMYILTSDTDCSIGGVSTSSRVSWCTSVYTNISSTDIG